MTTKKTAFNCYVAGLIGRVVVEHPPEAQFEDVERLAEDKIQALTLRSFTTVEGVRADRALELEPAAPEGLALGTLQGRAALAAYRVIAELTGRRDFRSRWWDGIDKDTQAEITTAIAAQILATQADTP